VRPGERVLGTVAAGHPPDSVANAGQDGATPRWFVTLDLDGREVSGSDVVTIAFSPADAACESSESLELDRFAEGTAVDSIRVGNSTDDMSPPIIGATDVTVEC
jgi:hypothetical protein